MTQLNPRDIVRLVSRKRSWRLKPFQGTSMFMPGRYWDGGSRDEYALYNPKTNSLQHILSINPMSRAAHEQDVAVPEGFLVIEYGTFCGKPATPTIHYRPEEYSFEGVQP